MHARFEGDHSERRARCEIVLDGLAPGRAPHALVAQNVRERRVERADPVRHADDERVHTNRHDTPRLRLLAVKRVKLAAGVPPFLPTCDGGELTEGDSF